MSRTRRALIEELLSLPEGDALAGLHRQQALAWARSGAPLCRTAKPATPPQHLVSYFLPVDGEHLLLLDHRNAGLWLPPGGHVEPDEHPRETVRREFEEELGLPLAPAVIGAPQLVTITRTVGLSAGHVDVSLWYLVPLSRGAALRPDAVECQEARWFHCRDAPLQRSDPHLGRLIAQRWGPGPH